MRRSPIRGRIVCPVRCPACGEPMPPCVPERVLEAARAVATLPDRQGTAADVAAALRRSQRQASYLLQRTAAAGLVRQVGTIPGAGGHHGGASRKLYEAQPILAAYP